MSRGSHSHGTEGGRGEGVCLRRWAADDCEKVGLKGPGLVILWETNLGAKQLTRCGGHS